ADVVHLADARDTDRGLLRTLAHLRVAPLRLDVDDDVALRQRALDGVLDRVGRGVALGDGRAGRDADHDIGEVAARRLAHAQAAQAAPGHPPGDRLARPPVRAAPAAV